MTYRALRLVALCGCAVVVTSCSSCRIIIPDDGAITLISYNVENLFDATVDGTEYADFTPDAGWDEAAAHDAMARVAAGIAGLRIPVDILVLIEVEHRGVVDTLLDTHLPDLPLPYRVAAASPASATTVAVASRYPIIDVRTLLPRSGTVPSLRPMLEVRLDLGDSELIVIANHWKSKRGGAAATEPLRRAAARLLAARLADLALHEPQTPVVVCGDFNLRPDELVQVDYQWPTALVQRSARERLAATDADERPRWVTDAWLAHPDALILDDTNSAGPWQAPGTLIDLWARSDAPGSYFFGGWWERIDGIYVSPVLADGLGLDVASFAPVVPPGGVDSEGRPLSRDQGGVSDHLPLVLTIERRE